ncbi:MULTISPECIES: hypothetical protein [Streptomycetaceae]|uniref:hypothetical protein n=1 Tax=Streptomycetaceae TaxID=2062 RepID=UPI00300BA598
MSEKVTPTPTAARLLAEARADYGTRDERTDRQANLSGHQVNARMSAIDAAHLRNWITSRTA